MSLGVCIIGSPGEGFVAHSICEIEGQHNHDLSWCLPLETKPSTKQLAKFLRDDLAVLIGEAEIVDASKFPNEFQMFCLLNEIIGDNAYPSAQRSAIGEIFRLAADVVKREKERNPLFGG